MKKKYIYMFVPLAGLIIFALFYIPFSRSYDQKIEDRKRADLKMKEDELRQQAEARSQAIIKANEDAERRKKEREAKAAQEQAEKDALDAADAARTKAFNDRNKYKDEAAGLQRQIEAEQKAIAELEHDKQEALKEQEFLKTYIQQAEDNAHNISGLLQKLADAEKARADADAAAKKAANNS
jgi:hypothetical protein